MCRSTLRRSALVWHTLRPMRSLVAAWEGFATSFSPTRGRDERKELDMHAGDIVRACRDPRSHG